MLIQSVLALISFTIPILTEATASNEDGSCSANFKICAPAGVKSDTLGPIGPAWGELYNDIVNVVSDYGISSQPPAGNVDLEEQAGVFCCANVADCLLVPVFDVAMCWDRFTTNVYFADGTYGTVVTGDFNTSDGVSINLVYGDYTMKNGTTGNIYSGSVSSSVMPDTSTLPMPTPWTSSGEGSAIPATGLGTSAIMSVVTSTIPATTTPPSTGSSITIIDTMTGCNHCPAYNTTIPGLAQSGGTRPASTITSTTGIITPTITPNFGISHRPGNVISFLFFSIAMVISGFLK